MTREDIPTPALLVDLDILEANLATMARHAAEHGKALRPHAKAHKCAEIAKLQMAAGATGICAATVEEAEGLAKAGISNLLLTSPLASPSRIRQMALLSRQVSELTVVVDHERQVQWYQQAAAAHNTQMNMLVDLDVGDHRTGIPPERAMPLVRAVEGAPNLHWRGFQAYCVRASHVTGYEQRKACSEQALERAVRLRRETGAAVLTGGSTGSYNIDAALAGVTELQAGSYVFLDLAYARIGSPGSDTFCDFGHALTVLATVVSASHRAHVTVDAGFKAFSTDRPFGPEARDISGVRYRWAGDEFGYLDLDQPSREVQLGDRIPFLPPHCDPTVNLYDCLYACRGERVEAIWPILRRRAAGLTPP